MRLKRALRLSVAAACIASAAAPAGLAAPTAAPAAMSALEVRVAQADEFSRIEFHWKSAAAATSRREGQTLVLAFNRDADPDISRLRTAPPRWVKSAEKRRVGGRLELAITLAD